MARKRLLPSKKTPPKLQNNLKFPSSQIKVTKQVLAGQKK